MADTAEALGTGTTHDYTLPLDRAETTLPIVSADLIRRALDRARAIPPDDFRDQESKWLQTNLSPLSVAIGRMFGWVLQRGETDEVAYGALQGAHLGGSILRQLIDEGLVEQAKCIDNLNALQIGDRGISYDGSEVGREPIVRLYGEEAASAFDEIRSPAARTVCQMVLGIALISPKS